jgi:hypothetical protein
MDRRFATKLFTLAALALSSLGGSPLPAGVGSTFSVLTDQWVTTPGGGVKLLHQGLYMSRASFDAVTPVFLPSFMGLDAADILQDGSILFSISTSTATIPRPVRSRRRKTGARGTSRRAHSMPWIA